MGNINDLIIMNMYNNGNINIDNNEDTFISLQNDYIIELKRKNIKLFLDEKFYDYKCILTFKNNIGNILFEIVLTEQDIYTIIDCINNYMEFNMNDIFIPTNSSNTSNYSKYTFKLCKGNEYNLYYLSIYENNMKRINIAFNEEYTSIFLNKLYFTFLIDLNDYQFDEDCLF